MLVRKIDVVRTNSPTEWEKFVGSKNEILSSSYLTNLGKLAGRREFIAHLK